MKKWVVDYSVKFNDGVEEECTICDIEAKTLIDAYEYALIIVQGRVENEEIADALIWNVGLVWEDVKE